MQCKGRGEGGERKTKCERREEREERLKEAMIGRGEGQRSKEELKEEKNNNGMRERCLDERAR